MRFSLYFLDIKGQFSKTSRFFSRPRAIHNKISFCREIEVLNRPFYKRNEVSVLIDDVERKKRDFSKNTLLYSKRRGKNAFIELYIVFKRQKSASEISFEIFHLFMENAIFEEFQSKSRN